MTRGFVIWGCALILFVAIRWTVTTINDRTRTCQAQRLVGEAERDGVHADHILELKVQDHA